MEQSQAQRTLVKSPPELWAELSSEDSLGRHLGEFGEIRITRVKPETTVAWEGDRASGTVQIEPTGWGTKVTLTATAAAEPVVEPEVLVQPEPLAEPEPPTPMAMISLRELARASQPAFDEPDPATRGFFARFFRRPAPDLAPAPLDDTAPAARAEIPTPPAPTPDPSPPTPGPDPTPPGPGPAPSPQPAPDPAPPGPGPDPLPPPTIQMPQLATPATAAEREPERAAPALDPHRTVAILTEVLDDLGAAHHRPFSRG